MTQDSNRPPYPGRPLRTRRWPWAVVVGLAAVGLALSIFLVYEHYDACHHPGQAICDVSEVISCSKVSLSDYSVFLGVPVAVWGVIGYLVMAGVALWGWFSGGSRAAVAALAPLTLFSALVSIALGVVSKVLIGAICLFCVGTYAVNALLVVPSMALLVSSGAGATFSEAIALARARWTGVLAWAVGAALVLGALMLFYPKYWLETNRAPQPEPEVVLPPASSGSANPDFTTGVTPDGHHWIGATKPRVVIEEYSDYQCPFCRIAHARLRELIQKHPGVIRLVHRHFPLDQRCNPIITEPFHPNACYYSALVTCSGEQKKFWPANDYVFKHGHDAEPITVEKLASELRIDGKQIQECLEKRAWDKIRPDLEAGIKLEIHGTPTFVIDGKPQMGADPDKLLERYLPKKP